MSDPSLSLEVRELLQHTSWVRALARRLSVDDSAAADVEQATWLAALRSRPRAGVPARSWLGTIVRNFARQGRREQSARLEHELRAARNERTPSADDVVERAELQQRLVEAVMRLDEPYRTAILLRYFDDLPPREIARRTGHPIATVRTHLARGIERLRARLDGEHGGDRRAWLAAFAPLWLPPVDSTLPTLVGTALMNAKIVVAALLVSFAAVGVWWVNRDDPQAIPPTVEAARSEPRAAERAHESSGGADTLEPRAEVQPQPAPTSQASSTTHVATERGARRVGGRVLDAFGDPVAAVRLLARSDGKDGKPAEVELFSDATGRFEIADAPDHGEIACADPRMVTVMRSSFRAEGAQEPIVVVAPRLDFGGVIIDERGAGLSTAEISFELPEDFRARFREVLDRSKLLDWRADSGDDGSFELVDAPLVEGSRLATRLEGFVPDSRPAPEHSDLGLRVTLKRPLATDGVVRGAVVDASNRPVEGAHVALGYDSVRSRADGSFEFTVDDARAEPGRPRPRELQIVALKPGLLPAHFVPPASDGKPQWPAFVTLRLEGEPLSLAGVVNDAAGSPMAGVLVYVADATLFGAVDGRPAMVEGLLAQATRMWSFVETDDAGRFEVRGLLDREYVLRAHDPRTLLRVDSEPVRAGSRGVELRLPTNELYARVAGRVVSHGGAPVAGADIYPMCDALQARAGGQILGTAHDRVDGVKTDSEGRFELRNVPHSLVYLRIDGESVLPLEYGRYVEGDERFANTEVRELPRDRIESLEIRVELRCHVQFELRDATLADEVAVLDGSGHELVLSLFEAESRREDVRHPIHDGRSAVLGVPDTGRTVVLFRGGVEVSRAPLKLDPAQLTTVRL